jgi:RNA polymerase sigma-70 factor (ECF subfamily)
MSRHEFRELFEEKRTPVFRLLLRLCRDRGEAEDLLQEAFLTVWRKRAQFRGQGSAEGYVRKTAMRLFLNRRRKLERRSGILRRAGGRLPTEEETQPATADVAATLDIRRFVAARVAAALERLPEGAREAFVMFRHGGLSCREIAELTGVPPKTVESRLRRASMDIATALKPHAKDLASR